MATIRPLAPIQAEVAAALHAAAMAAGTGDEAWSAGAIREILETHGAFGMLSVEERGATAEPVGFVLCRMIVGEVEILALAVAPGRQRRGIGRRLLVAALDAGRRAGARRALLEVAVDNPAARMLYAAAGFEQAGRRRGYYLRAGGTRVDSLVLAKPL